MLDKVRPGAGDTGRAKAALLKGYCKPRQITESPPKFQGPIRAELHIGGRNAGITLARDPVWPMWRVRRGDQASDIVNLTRAKDAAIAWARPRGLGGDEVVRWDHRETPGAASLMRKNGGGL